MEELVTFYWPSVCRKKEDGTISLKVSGAENGCLWTGGKDITPSDPEYGFWDFVYQIRDRYPTFFDDAELARLKKDFEEKDFTTDN